MIDNEIPIIHLNAHLVWDNITDELFEHFLIRLEIPYTWLANNLGEQNENRIVNMLKTYFNYPLILSKLKHWRFLEKISLLQYSR